jgi:hypothetical protein
MTDALPLKLSVLVVKAAPRRVIPPSRTEFFRQPGLTLAYVFISTSTHIDPSLVPDRSFINGQNLTDQSKKLVCVVVSGGSVYRQKV